MEDNNEGEQSSKSRKKKRGRVQLARIEDKTSRQVRFSKRRSGLFKKAFELAVLCDAEVALLVFSPAGRLFEFSSSSCLEKTYQRYNQFMEGQKDTKQKHLNIDLNTIPNEETEISCSDFSSKVLEIARWSNRESIHGLKANDLEELEKLLVDALKLTKSKKNLLIKEREEKAGVIVEETAFEEVGGQLEGMK